MAQSPHLLSLCTKYNGQLMKRIQFGKTRDSVSKKFTDIERTLWIFFVIAEFEIFQLEI